MKRPCVEFYASTFTRTGAGVGKVTEYGWRLRATNGQIILSPHETFISHRNAVASFKRICDALGAVGVYQVRDLEGIKGDSIRMLERA